MDASTRKREFRRTPAKALEKMTNAEFSQHVRSNFGFEPLGDGRGKQEPLTIDAFIDGLIAQHTNEAPIKPLDLLLALAHEKLFSDRPMRPELFDIIAKQIGGKRKWALAQRKVNKAKSYQKVVYWQHKANAHWKRDPKLSNSEVGKLVSQEIGDGSEWAGDSDYIRQVIHKPKKNFL